MTLSLRRALLAASVLTLVGPSVAFADVTIEQVGTELTVIATGTSGNGAEIDVRRTSLDADGINYVYTEGFGTVTSSVCEQGQDEASSLWYCDTSALSGVNVDISGTGGGNVSLGEGLLPDAHTAYVIGGNGPNRFYADRESTFNVNFTGGDEADVAQFGSGDDYFVGQGGDDQMYSSPGDDSFFAGPGKDVMEAGDAADGSDAFDGGSQPADSDETSHKGDVVNYGDRTDATTVILASVTAGDTFQPGSGAAGENDLLLGTESVEGSAGPNTITGNESANGLFGGPENDTINGGDGNDLIVPETGADSVNGGGGDDAIEVRRDSYDPAPDVDAALDCGPGTDRIRRDHNDAAPVNCEQDVPGFLRPTSTLVGTLNVGSVLTVTGLDYFAGPGTTETTWYSCETADHEKCKEVATAPTYTLAAADQGRHIATSTIVSDALGFGDYSSTDISAAIGAALPAPPAATPTPAPPVPTFAQTSQAAATKALGVGATLLNTLKLGEGVAAFTPAAVKKNTLPLGKKPAPVLAIACQAACAIEAKIAFTLPGAKGKKAKTLKLKTQKANGIAGSASVITVQTSAAQRKAIKASKNPKVAVTVSVKTNGKTTKGKKSLKLKVKP